MSREKVEKLIISYCKVPRSKQEVVEFTQLSKRQVGYILKTMLKTKQLAKYHNLNDLRSHYYKSDVNEISVDTV